MDLEQKIQRFIELAGGGHLERHRKTLIGDLLMLPPRDGDEDEKLITHVMQHPELLPVKLGYQVVYDYFYEKMLEYPPQSSKYNFWVAALILATKYLRDENVEHADVIFLDKKYIMNLQSDISNHSEVFSYLIGSSDFCLTPRDYEFLACALAARGELPKLLALSRKINLARIRPLMATALAYGRNEVISFLINGLKFKLSDYGRILDLEFFVDQPKFLYYCSDLSSRFEERDIVGSVKDYGASIALIYNSNKLAPVTLHTLDVWTELATRRNLPFSTIYQALRPLMRVEIPLEHDFGKFNEIVFGVQWSKRSHIVEYCKRLEQENYELTVQIEALTQQLHGLHGFHGL